jgi:hypothetical protein
VVVVVATGPITRRAKRTNSTAEPSRGPPRRELGVRRARVTSSHGSGSKGAASSPAVTRQTEMPLSSRPGKETGTDRHVRSPRRPRAMPMCHRWAGDGDGTRPVARHDSSRPQVLIIPAPRGGADTAQWPGTLRSHGRGPARAPSASSALPASAPGRDATARAPVPVRRACRWRWPHPSGWALSLEHPSWQMAHRSEPRLFERVWSGVYTRYVTAE